MKKYKAFVTIKILKSLHSIQLHEEDTQGHAPPKQRSKPNKRKALDLRNRKSNIEQKLRA